ncbi:TPA: cytochrome C, partial [Burkholderia multivorans]
MIAPEPPLHCARAAARGRASRLPSERTNMNLRLPHLAAACALASGAALTALPAAAAPVRVCSLPGTPTAALDKAVAR